MADFSVIAQAPEIRAIVQENALERAFHDALFPSMLYRIDVTPELWEANTGDNRSFSAPGLLKPQMAPLKPGVDPSPQSYGYEQWTSTMQQYAGTIDTPMPTSIVAIADLFMRNAQQLGLQAAQSLNRLVRDRMYNAALSGQTVANGTQNGVTSLKVKRLNGFTKTRDTVTVGGSPVQFAPVSSTNKLAIKAGASLNQFANVIGFTADTPGDETGPGTLTLDSAVTVTDRDPVISADASSIVRVGGGNSVDAIGNTDLMTLDSIRSAVARMRTMNVPAHADGRYHAHIDPIVESQLFSDTQVRELLRSLPEYYMAKDFAMGELMGVVFYRNTENPQAFTVNGGSTNTYDPSDPFGGELLNASATPIHYSLFTGADAIFEYYNDLSKLITEAGIQGKTGEWSISNNGIDVFCERIQMILRSPQNRLQDMVAASWRFMGDWPVRTDVLTGDAARYKRMVVVESGE